MIATVSRLIPAHPAEVWETLTSHDAMKELMMGAEVETDWKIGHAITMRGQVDGRTFEEHGEIRSFEPRRKLSYTHESSSAPGQTHLVTFELEMKGRGTEVTVTQAPAGGIDAADDERLRPRYERTWAMMLRDLEQAVMN